MVNKYLPKQQSIHTRYGLYFFSSIVYIAIKLCFRSWIFFRLQVNKKDLSRSVASSTRGPNSYDFCPFFFTWRRKKIQLPKQNFIEIQAMDKVWKTNFTDYNAPSSEPFILHSYTRYGVWLRPSLNPQNRDSQPFKIWSHIHPLLSTFGPQDCTWRQFIKTSW
jgi:hypothetical protein